MGSALVVAGIALIATVVWPQFLVAVAWWTILALANDRFKTRMVP